MLCPSWYHVFRLLKSTLSNHHQKKNTKKHWIQIILFWNVQYSILKKENSRTIKVCNSKACHYGLRDNFFYSWIWGLGIKFSSTKHLCTFDKYVLNTSARMTKQAVNTSAHVTKQALNTCLFDRACIEHFCPFDKAGIEHFYPLDKTSLRRSKSKRCWAVPL